MCDAHLASSPTPGKQVVSLHEILGDKCPSVAEVRAALARVFAQVLPLPCQTECVIMLRADSIRVIVDDSQSIDGQLI